MSEDHRESKQCSNVAKKNDIRTQHNVDQGSPTFQDAKLNSLPELIAIVRNIIKSSIWNKSTSDIIKSRNSSKSTAFSVATSCRRYSNNAGRRVNRF
jgi:hypothetical protein